MAMVVAVTVRADSALLAPTAPLNVTVPDPAFTVRGEAARLVSFT